MPHLGKPVPQQSAAPLGNMATGMYDCRTSGAIAGRPAGHVRAEVNGRAKPARGRAACGQTAVIIRMPGGGKRGTLRLGGMRVAQLAEIEAKVKKIVAEQLSVNEDELTRETSFINDLNADSLDTVELVMGFEEAFDLNIPDEEAEKIQTIGDAIDHIGRYMNGKADA